MNYEGNSKTKEERLVEIESPLGSPNDRGLRSRSCLVNALMAPWRRLHALIADAIRFGRSDPKKVIYSAKVGLALALTSLVIFWQLPLEDISKNFIWAIVTVVLLFEFTIGGTFSKGFNRGIGTFTAGVLALCTAELLALAGDYQEIVVALSLFTMAFVSTFVKQYPSMKPYEYGFRVFLLTYCMVVVSGVKKGTFLSTAATRTTLILLGASICLVVNIGLYPNWAGEDLHKLVVKNFTSLAGSVEGCVNGYLRCLSYERCPSKIVIQQAKEDPLYKGYKTAIESATREETLVGFAIWEPPHGPYKKMKYPWRSYVELCGALRHCAFAVMALHGCVISEIQASPEKRQVFKEELHTVGMLGAKVLRELGDKVKAMVKLSPGEILADVHQAAEALQKKIDQRSYLLVNSAHWEVKNKPLVRREVEAASKAAEDEAREKESFLTTKSKSKSLTANLNPRDSFPASKSLSHAAVIDLEGVGRAKSWDVRNTSSSSLFKHPVWPHRNPLAAADSPAAGRQDDDADSETYESASALSLATFSSLLIEFVARLQNVVETFEELSEKAEFHEAVAEEGIERLNAI